MSDSEKLAAGDWLCYQFADKIISCRFVQYDAIPNILIVEKYDEASGRYVEFPVRAAQCFFLIAAESLTYKT